VNGKGKPPPARKAKANANASAKAAAPAPARPTLAVLVDGVPLPEDAARELWTRFSRHMDENEGDAAGFARLNAFASVSPEYRKGQAVLVVKR
jgi:hypothetical protein